MTLAKNWLALSLAKLLHALQLQLDQYRQHIEALLAHHPDHFQSASRRLASDSKRLTIW